MTNFDIPVVFLGNEYLISTEETRRQGIIDAELEYFSTFKSVMAAQNKMRASKKNGKKLLKNLKKWVDLTFGSGTYFKAWAITKDTNEIEREMKKAVKYYKREAYEVIRCREMES